MTVKEMKNKIVWIFGLENVVTIEFFTICEYETENVIKEYFATAMEMFQNLVSRE